MKLQITFYHIIFSDWCSPIKKSPLEKNLASIGGEEEVYFIKILSIETFQWFVHIAVMWFNKICKEILFVKIHTYEYRSKVFELNLFNWIFRNRLITKTVMSDDSHPIWTGKIFFLRRGFFSTLNFYSSDYFYAQHIYWKITRGGGHTPSSRTLNMVRYRITMTNNSTSLVRFLTYIPMAYSLEKIMATYICWYIHFNFIVFINNSTG